MSRMKTFFTYALLVIVFYFFTDFISFAALRTAIKPIENYEVKKQEGQVLEIETAEAAYMNGRVKGKLTNASSQDLTGQYIKLDFFSERDVNLGTKYIIIDNNQAKQGQEFDIKFNYEGVKKFTAEVTDEFSGQEWDLFSDPERNKIYLLGALLALYAIF